MKSGPSSISTFLFPGSTRAVFAPGDNPNKIILSTVHSEENLSFPAEEGAAFEDVSFPFENVKNR